jgi:BirA family transcriptional regulator, biotin operon repressor / biotin---[acetyl-CoA-carboxylase] ligase
MTAPAEPSPPVVRLPSVESTQAVAWRLAAEGRPDRTVVVADHQSAGRGRRGRAWTDAPGTSLLVSILVRPRVPLGLWPLFSLTTAVAAVEALRRSTGLEARLKWPNDVLARGRKLGGILLESRGSAHDPVLVIGVGLNLAQREFPLELAGLATSVALETGSAPARDAVLAALLDEFDAWRARLESEGAEPVRARWLALGETIGRQVTIDGITGVAVGLDADGALLVEDAAYGTRRIVAGEIAGPAPAPRGRVGDAARR